MEKLTVGSAEHTFYKAGEQAGAAGAMENVAKELRVAGDHYRQQQTQGSGKKKPASKKKISEQQAAVERLAEILHTLAAQIEQRATESRKAYSQLVDEALRLSVGRPSFTDRLRRAVSGARTGWKGRS